MKIKMLTSLAGGAFSLAHGEIVETATIGGEAVAKAWIAEGHAIEAPGEDIAAAQIAGLQARLDDCAAARSGLEKELVEAKGRIAKAQAEAKGAVAEMAVHKAARTAAENDLATLTAQIDRAHAAVGERDDLLGDNADLRARLVDAEAARDEFQRQAEELARQHAAAAGAGAGA